MDDQNLGKIKKIEYTDKNIVGHHRVPSIKSITESGTRKLSRIAEMIYIYIGIEIEYAQMSYIN